MNKQNDKLNQAIEALREIPVPQGPSDQLMRQTLNRIQQTQDQLPPAATGKRRFSMKTFTKLAIAACVLFAILGGISIIDNGSSGIVLADVVQRMEQAKAIFYKIKVTTTGQPLTASDMPMNIDGAVWISTDYGMKMEMNMNGQPGSIAYLLADQNKLVTVMPTMKKYMEVELNDDLLSKIKQQNQDPREWVQKMVDSQYQSIGKSTIDGIEVEGFESSDPALAGGISENILIRLWVDTQTGYPIQLEMDMNMNGGKTQMHSVVNDFQWNLEIDQATFLPEITEDYTPLPKMQMPKMDQESAIAGFKAYTEMTGQYPESLSMMAISDGIQKATKDGSFLKSKLFDPNQFKGLSKEEAKEEAIKKSMDMVMPIQSLALFYMTLVEGNKDPAYYGKFVTPGDTQSVLLRWKIDDSTYKVIMGDLSVTDMSQEELLKIESQMPAQDQPTVESPSSSIPPLEDAALYAQLEGRGRNMINIKKMLLACFKYAGQNNGQWPTTLEAIAGQDGIQTEGHIYILPDKAIPPQKNVVIYESYEIWGDGINVGFADGHVEFIGNEGDFHNLLSQ